MKAKISYTTDVKDIPYEVNKLLLPQIGKLEDFLKDSSISLTKDNIDLSMLKIEMLRKILLNLDTRLDECYSILQGYKQATSDISPVKEADDEPVSE